MKVHEEYFRVQELAQRWRLSPAKLFSDIAKNKLKATRFGRSVRISAAAAEEYLQSLGAK